jgi:transposase
MAILSGLDIHRGQITFDWADSETGELRGGVLRRPDRERLRRWLAQFEGQEADFAVEGCTGWRYVAEEVMAAGFRVHVAEPAEAQARRGRKQRAKTDRTDARLLRQLLAEGRLPESWVPPAHVLEARAMIRLYKALVDTRRQWLQRIHAVLFHHGVAAPEFALTSSGARPWLEQSELTPAARWQVATGLGMIDFVNTELAPLRRELTVFARRQPGCRALWQAHFGVGPIIAVAVWAELGDCSRFTSSAQAVRHTGLDVTVHASDTTRHRGHLARQGPPVLRWALYEAGKCAARRTAPDYEYYQAVKARQGGNRAAMSVARKIGRRSYHTLRDLGEQALAPVA